MARLAAWALAILSVAAVLAGCGGGRSGDAQQASAGAAGGGTETHGASATGTETAETEPPSNTGTADTGSVDTGAVEDGFPNAAEAALLEHVPADEGIQATCARDVDLVPPGAIAGVVCAAAGDTTLFYYQFDGLDSMNAWYDGVVADAGALPDSGDCVEDEFAEGTWPYRESVGGRRLCAPSRDGAYRYIFWTSDGDGIGAVAATASTMPEAQRSLFDLWLSTLSPT